MVDNSTKERGNGKQGNVVTFRHATADKPGELSALQREQLDAMMADMAVRDAALGHLLGASDEQLAGELGAALQVQSMQQALAIGLQLAHALKTAEQDPEAALQTMLGAYSVIMAAMQPLQTSQEQLKKAIGDVALPLERNIRAHGYEAQYRPGYTTVSYPKAQLQGLAAASEQLAKALDKIKSEKQVAASVAVRKV